ncbi:MAG: hypothetical protein JRG76_01700 [Deltaproteobacteria bacterium]|nr:hypothetical protein [Deltaproteobacteria bacterium]MBW2413199.1 hypothetical protein [Deltaproteobacteria bacterium]
MSDPAALREAACVLPAERVIAALEGTFAAWRAPGSAWRDALARACPVWSRAAIERGVCDGLDGWTADVLRALRRRELENARAPALAAVWLAGTVPTGTFSALALPLLAGCAVQAKPASSDPETPRLFAASLRECDAGVADALALDADDSALDEADAVVAYGSDETVRILRGRAGARPFVGYGHKLSAAAVGRDADLAGAAERAALDVCLWDGRGCLSPAWIFVDDPDGERTGAFGEALSTALERLRTDIPRGALQAGEAVALRERRAREALRSPACWFPSGEGSSDWGVFVAGGEAAAPGTLRNVPLVSVEGIDGLAARCTSLAPGLSSLGHEGFGGERRLLEVARAGGGSRVCALGRMQLPPIDWPHDGMGALQPVVPQT